MNNTFNASRFCLLLKRQWLEYRKVYLSSVAILFGSLIMLYTFSILINNQFRFGQMEQGYLTYFSRLNFRNMILMMTLLIFLSFFAGQHFNRYSKTATAIQELTLPVSALEKIMVAVLTAVLLGIVTYVVVCLTVDALFVSILRKFYDNGLMRELRMVKDGNEGFRYIGQQMRYKECTVFAVMGFTLSSVFLLGSIYFKKLSYLKTAFAAVLLFMFITIIPGTITGLWYQDYVSVTDYAHQPTIPTAVFIVIILLMILSIWTAIYYRLKEKEV